MGAFTDKSHGTLTQRYPHTAHTQAQSDYSKQGQKVRIGRFISSLDVVELFRQADRGTWIIFFSTFVVAIIVMSLWVFGYEYTSHAIHILRGTHPICIREDNTFFLSLIFSGVIILWILLLFVGEVIRFIEFRRFQKGGSARASMEASKKPLLIHGGMLFASIGFSVWLVVHC